MAKRIGAAALLTLCFARTATAGPPFVTDDPEPVDPGVPAVVATQESHTINLNKADVDTLTQSFKGIGRKRAEAIVAYREANGEFKSLDDLALVKGIGRSKG